jgi:hypothetical protein
VPLLFCIALKRIEKKTHRPDVGEWVLVSFVSDWQKSYRRQAHPQAQQTRRQQSPHTQQACSMRITIP